MNVKNKLHCQIILFLSIIIPLNLYAATVVSPPEGALFDEKSGLYFLITNDGLHEVSTTHNTDKKGWNSYSELEGEISVPSKVMLNGMEYTVRAIGEGTFKGNKTLTKVNLPSTITSIEREAFYKASALKEAVVPKTVSYIGRMAYAESGISRVEIPEEVGTIDVFAFRLCNNLTDFRWYPNKKNAVLPGEALHQNAVLSTVRLGVNVTVLDYLSLAKLPLLTTLTIDNPVPPSIVTTDDYEDTFDGTPLENVALIVPEGSEGLYGSSEGWNKLRFKEIKPSSITIRPSSIILTCPRTYLKTGESVQVSAVISPENAGNKKIEWSSSDETVISVDNNGTVIAGKEGTAVVTARCQEVPQVSASLSFNVESEITSQEYVTLTFKDCEGGSVAIRYVKDSEAVVQLISAEDWEIVSVTLDAVDMTSALDNGILSLGKLSASRTLRVIYEMTVGLPGMEYNGLSEMHIAPFADGLRIDTPETVNVKIYNIDGSIVEERLVSSSVTETIRLDSGIYILKAEFKSGASRIYKFMI